MNYDELSDRDLDAVVAEKVMGWRWWRTKLRFSEDVRRALAPPHFDNKEWQPSSGSEELFGGEPYIFLPHYSTDVESAMEVIEKMRADAWSFACTLYEGKLPYASFCKGTVASSENAEAESLPRAICIAALKAKAA